MSKGGSTALSSGLHACCTDGAFTAAFVLLPAAHKKPSTPVTVLCITVLPAYATCMPFHPLTVSRCAKLRCFTLCLLQVFLTQQYLGIAMEFASGGDMFEYVVKKNGLREEEARWFFQQLIVGLDYCHRMVRGAHQQQQQQQRQRQINSNSRITAG
jgi:hypothetical protein